MSVDDHCRTRISDFASVLLWHLRSTLWTRGVPSRPRPGMSVLGPDRWVAQFAPEAAVI